MGVIDTVTLLHDPLVEYWTQEYRDHAAARSRTAPTTFQLAAQSERGGALKRANGDVLLEQLQNLFLHGFGIDWSPIQIKIFKSLVDSMLPRIYTDEWEEVKTRVMAERKIDRLKQETLVNMARRNGKTWVVSGAAAAIYLVIPNVSLAIFSVGKRQATLFMSSTLEKIEMAFTRGTHVRKQGYAKITQNQEMVVYEHPLGGKQVLGCYPGSTKVSDRVFFS